VSGWKFVCQTCDSVRRVDESDLPECCRTTVIDMSTELNRAVIRILAGESEQRGEFGDRLANELIVSGDPAARAAAIAWRNFRCRRDE
jgi:hypothetical protein